MKNYTVVVSETLRREIVVKANDYMDALRQVEDMWAGEEFVLNADDFDEVEFMEMSTGNCYCV